MSGNNFNIILGGKFNEDVNKKLRESVENHFLGKPIKLSITFAENAVAGIKKQVEEINNAFEKSMKTITPSNLQKSEITSKGQRDTFKELGQDFDKTEVFFNDKKKKEILDYASATNRATKENEKLVSSQKKLENTSEQLSTRIKNLGNDNIISKKKVSEFNAELAKIKSLPVEQQANAFKNLNQRISDGKKQAMGFGEMLKVAFSKMGVWLIAGDVFFKTIAMFKNVVKQVIALDTALVELNKVADLSKNQMKEMSDYAFRLGRETATTGTNVLKAITDIKRAGYELEQSKSLAKYAIMLTNVAEGIKDTGVAANYLISILKGANLEVEYASKLLDAMNEISNNSAVSFDALASMTQRITGTMSTLGNSVEETMALVTGAYEVLQDERVAKGISIIGLRIAGLNEDLEKEEGLASKVGEAFLKYANIDIMGMDGQLKDSFDILEELAGKWNGLSKNAQTYLLTEAAGKNRADVLSSLMKNWEGVAEAMEQVANSAGSAEIEQTRYLNSVQAKIENVKNSFQELSATTLNSDVVKGLISATDSLIKFIDSAGGLVPVLALLGLGFGAYKSIMRFVNIEQKKVLVDTIALTTATEVETVVTQGATAATVTQKMAYTATALAARSLAIAMGAITAVATIVISVISAINQAEEKRIRLLEESNEKTEKNIEKLKEQRKEYNESYNGVEKLKSEQIALMGIENKTSEQKKRLTQITNELAKAQERLNKATSDGTNVTGDYSKELFDKEIKENEEYIRKNKINAEKAEKELSKKGESSFINRPFEKRIRSEIINQGGQYGEKKTFIKGTLEERIEILRKIIDSSNKLTNLTKMEQLAVSSLIIEYDKLNEKQENLNKIATDYNTAVDIVSMAKGNIEVLTTLEKSVIKFTNATTEQKIEMLGNTNGIESQIEALENLKKQYPSAIAYIDNYIVSIKEQIKVFKEEDLLLNAIDKSMSAVNKKKSEWQKTQEALKKEREEKEKLLAVEKAREELATAKEKKVTLIRGGKEVYVSDFSEIEKAQIELDKAEQNLKDFLDEKQFEKELKALEALNDIYNQALLDSGAETVREFFRQNQNLLDNEKTTYEERLNALRAFLSEKNKIELDSGGLDFTTETKNQKYKDLNDPNYNNFYSGKTKNEVAKILKEYPRRQTSQEKLTKKSLEDFMASDMKEYHTGGIVGDVPFANNQEMFAKLKLGEIVLPKNSFNDVLGKVKSSTINEKNSTTFNIASINLTNPINNLKMLSDEILKINTPTRIIK